MRAARLCVFLLVLGLAAAGRSGGAGVVIDPSALLLRYEPVLLFHPQEEWAPSQPDEFVAHARVEKQVKKGSWAPVPPPQPTSTSGCAFTPCYRFNLQPCALKNGDACYEASHSTAAEWKRPSSTAARSRPRRKSRARRVRHAAALPRALLALLRVRRLALAGRAPLAGARGRLGEHHDRAFRVAPAALRRLQRALLRHDPRLDEGREARRVTPGRVRRARVARELLREHLELDEFSECLRRYLDRPELARAKTIIRLAEDRLVDRTGTAHASVPAGFCRDH